MLNFSFVLSRVVCITLSLVLSLTLKYGMLEYIYYASFFFSSGGSFYLFIFIIIIIFIVVNFVIH